MSVPADWQHRLLPRSVKAECNSNLRGLPLQCCVCLCVCVCVCVCVCTRMHARSCAQLLRHVRLCTLTVTGQAPLSMVTPRQGYCSGLSFPPPGDLSHPGIKPGSPALAGGFFTVWAAREAPNYPVYCVYVYVHKRCCLRLALATFLFEVFWYAVLICHVTRVNLILWNEIKCILKDQGNNLFLPSCVLLSLSLFFFLPLYSFLICF